MSDDSQIAVDPDIKAGAQTEKRLRRVMILAGLGLVGAGIAQTGYLESIGGLVPKCPMHTLTGLNCPGCGGTRALMRLLHFDFLGALHDNPVAVLAAPFFVYAFIMSPNLNALPWKRWHVAMIIAFLVAFTILRNLPWYPWTMLSPP